MSVEIREVTTKKELKTFILYPQRLYRKNKYYVPSLFFDEMNTLSKDKNAAFKTSTAHLWLAYRDGELVGRIAGIHLPVYAEKWGENLVRFGWFDLIDDRIY